MTIEAQIICDSVSPAGIRLTTFQLRYPRFIHAELMTHRDFSRNASSSRAIPVRRMIEDLRRDPAMPIYWGSNKPGMQAGEELTGLALADAKQHWLDGMINAISEVEKLMEIGLHKQIANRVLEPWAHINVVLTATNWANWYTLRRDKHAQPEIKALADAMWDAQQASIPQYLEPGDWHLPYIRLYERLEASNHDQGFGAGIDALKRISVARCARVSYLTHDGRETTFEEDLQLYDRLLNAQPLHASPAEHQATPDIEIRGGKMHPITQRNFPSPELHGNFRGWIQYRKTLDGERILD
jgi:hypothetical protein